MLAVVLGAGLASFYLIPTVYETPWVTIDQVLAPGLRPQDNFLFATIPDAEHNQFNRFVSMIAAIEIVVLILVIWQSRGLCSGKKSWRLLAAWRCFALVMISITNRSGCTSALSSCPALVIA